VEFSEQTLVRSRPERYCSVTLSPQEGRA
jgi:hypothetical protein